MATARRDPFDDGGRWRHEASLRRRPPDRSFSIPAVHGHWLRELGIDGSYERIDVSPDDFASFFEGLRGREFVGGNVTIPHKEAAFRLVDALTPGARAIGAVNTLVIAPDGAILGDNTDAPGFTSHLDQSLGLDRVDRVQDALVLGAGGAARAIVVGLIDRGVSRIILANRTSSRSDALASSWPDHVTSAPWASLIDVMPRCGLLVNATSLGMVSHPPLDIDLSPLPTEAVVADIVYAPLETPLLTDARARGLQAVDGLGMLLHQAAPGFQRWFGIRSRCNPALRALIEADLAA